MLNTAGRPAWWNGRHNRLKICRPPVMPVRVWQRAPLNLFVFLPLSLNQLPRLLSFHPLSSTDAIRNKCTDKSLTNLSKWCSMFFSILKKFVRLALYKV